MESRGDYVEAIASYDRALNLRPKDNAACEIWHDRGNAFHYGLGDYGQAISCYERALHLNANHELALQNRGNALLYGLSLPEEALDYYNQALKIDSGNALAWRNRGNALVELRRYDEAIASYNRALAIKPDDQTSWHARSLAAEKSGFAERPPTTKPAWYGAGYGDPPTFVEGETDSDIVFASKHTATNEISQLPHGQPMFIIEDDWGRREILLEQDQYVVGRDPKSDICLHSQFVSRQHAVLIKIVKPNGRSIYQIIDGNLDGKLSTNGLLVNGQKCRMIDLQAEDVIVFGPRVRAVYHLLPPSTAYS
ncbi:MAG: tetratricopeptide repeat protein [Leptolyngbyaceae cyanobacterium RU_5_1]|nr:tetratricopeptide repeat protein [Leptolyngbyaceae cyanobacterium RU_5_1]